MKTKRLASEIFKLIRDGVPQEENKNNLVINGEKISSKGKKIITLEMTDEFVSVWSGIKNSSKEPSNIEVTLYVFNRMDRTLWVGGLVEYGDIVESKILFPKSVEYMCALNSMRNYIGDLFLMRPHDMRVLEIMDVVGKKTCRSSVENYLKVLYKMVAND